MTDSHANGLHTTNEPPLPRRDYFILPVVGLLTVVLLFAISNVIAGRYFKSDSGDDSCDVRDAAIGFRHQSNCKSRRKSVDGTWVTNQYNDCGYRTKQSCGPKPAGAMRIALLGSSTSLGLFVEDDQTFGALTAVKLEKDLGRPVEVQNLGRETCRVNCSLARVDEALALHPDILILAVNLPYDVEGLEAPPVASSQKTAPPPAAKKESLTQKAVALIKDSGTGAALVHFMTSRNPAFARSRIMLYLKNDGTAGYLKSPLSPLWEQRSTALDGLVAGAAAKARAAGVPLMLIQVPSLQQLTLMEMQNLPEGVDPYSFDRRMAEISARNGVQFFDAADVFKKIPDPNSLYYVVDGHINAEGHEVLSRALAELVAAHETVRVGRNELPQSAAGR